MSGQQITLDELKRIVELSKINLPQDMEVSDNGENWFRKSVIDFYQGEPLIMDSGQYARFVMTYKYFRLLNPHHANIEKLESEIKAAQAKLEIFKNSK